MKFAFSCCYAVVATLIVSGSEIDCCVFAISTYLVIKTWG